MAQETILRTEQITKSFGGHMAVNNVSLKIEENSLVSIIGPNGAGKTTLFNLISGQLTSTSGKVFFKGRDVTNMKPHQRALLGMGRSFQLTHLFPSLSALENVRLAAQARKRIGYQIFTDYLKDVSLLEEAHEALKQVNLQYKAAMPAASLTHGEKRKLEMAIILAQNPKVMLLDEPTAGMSLEDVPAIIEIISRIKRQSDRTIVLVEHKMDVILSLSDKIAVLVNGKMVAFDTPGIIMKNEQVQSAYLGEVV